MQLCGSKTEIFLCQEMRESENQQKYWETFMNGLKEHFDIEFVPLSEQNEDFCSSDIILLKITKGSWYWNETLDSRKEIKTQGGKRKLFIFCKVK